VPADELSQREQPGEVGVDEALPVLGALVLGGPGVGDSGVVDQDVDLAEVLKGRADQRLAISGQAHVAGCRPGVAQLCGQAEVFCVPPGGEYEAGARPSSTCAKRWPSPEDVPVTIATRPSIPGAARLMG
jgi:hypothetical protein